MLNSFSKAATTFALVLLFGSTLHAEDPIADRPGWDLTWHDEFDGDTLDTTKWTALDRKDSYNNEKQYYHPDQVEVSDGSLHLTAINVPREGKAYQSGLITSKDLYSEGRFEARIDLPTSQGMWPAFWLNANHVQWPIGGEIDILENRGSQPTRVSSAYHWQKDPGPCCDQHEHVTRPFAAVVDGKPVDYHADYHVYAVEWEAKELRFYVDDVLAHVVTETEDRPIIETPKNIILNLAVGGWFGGDPNETTIWPQTMHVDYVRYWQRNDDPLPGDYNNDGEVNAADYTVWRDTLSQTGIDLPADGSGNGVVSQSDYELWLAHFGTSTTSESAAAQVPEAHTSTLLVLGVGSLASRSPWILSNRKGTLPVRVLTVSR